MKYIWPKKENNQGPKEPPGTDKRLLKKRSLKDKTSNVANIQKRQYSCCIGIDINYTMVNPLKKMAQASCQLYLTKFKS